MTEEKQQDLQKKLTHIRRDAEERDAERRAEKTGTPYIDVRKVALVVEAIHLIPESDARAARIAALEHRTHGVAVAAFDPTSSKVKKILAMLEGKRLTPKLFVASLSGLEEAWRLYKFISPEGEDITGTFEIFITCRRCRMK